MLEAIFASSDAQQSYPNVTGTGRVLTPISALLIPSHNAGEDKTPGEQGYETSSLKLPVRSAAAKESWIGQRLRDGMFAELARGSTQLVL